MSITPNHPSGPILALDLRLAIASTGALLQWLEDIGPTSRAALFYSQPELPILLNRLHKAINIPAQQRSPDLDIQEAFREHHY